MPKAIFVTRCGCSREMDIPFPPQDVILLPLRPQKSPFHLQHVADDRMDVPNLGVRVFKRESGLHYPIYVEASEQRRA